MAFGSFYKENCFQLEGRFARPYAFLLLMVREKLDRLCAGLSVIDPRQTAKSKKFEPQEARTLRHMQRIKGLLGRYKSLRAFGFISGVELMIRWMVFIVVTCSGSGLLFRGHWKTRWKLPTIPLRRRHINTQRKEKRHIYSLYSYF